jgi:hypothetical protein
MSYPADIDKLQEDVTVEGITADYVWYNAKLLTDKMSFWEHDFQKLVGIMEARHKEHLKMIADLLQERGDLKRQIAVLKFPTKE